MELPHIPHLIKDPQAGVTYNVFAYRQLTREEVVQMVRMHISRQRKKPKRGSVVKIVSTFD